MKIKTLKDFIDLNAKEIRNLNDKELAKGLRYFRKDINYDLRKPLAPQSKGKLRRIRDELISQMSVPHKTLYAPRSKSHKKATAEFVGTSNKWKKFIIEKNPDEKIIFKKGKLKLKGKYTERGRTKFNYEDLIIDPEAEIYRIIENEKFESAHIQTGEHLLGGNKTPRDYGDDTQKKRLAGKIAKDVNYLLNVYNDTEKWLKGLELINFENQQSEKDFKKSRLNSKLKKKVRHAKKKNRRS